MTSEVGFVRNNPFIQNDMGIRKTCRIVPSASKLGISTGGGINWQCRKSNGVPQSASFPTISLGVKSQLERPIIVLQQHVNNKNLEEKGDSDIEYGPGIVKRLKERFNKISGSVSEEAEISPHSRRKRFPSVDDILSSQEITTERARRDHLASSRAKGYQSQDHLDNKQVPAPVLKTLANSAIVHDEGSASHGFTEAQASYVIHNPNRVRRLIPVSTPVVQPKEPEPFVDDKTLESISLLRAKFEQSSQAQEPQANSRPPRPSFGLPSGKENRPSEPEFLRVHRQLKKTRSITDDETTSSESCDYYSRNEAHVAPADPVPTKGEHKSRSVVMPINDRSPPPEEPKHRDTVDEESIALSDSDTASYDISAGSMMKSPTSEDVEPMPSKEMHITKAEPAHAKPKVNFPKDNSGIEEMHMLLSRFRKTTPAPPPPSASTVCSGHVVSISVGGDDLTDGDEVPQNTSASTASKRPASPGQKPPSECASPPRKSLSDRFLETKQQDRVNPIAEGESSGKPYGDDAIELSTDEEGHHGWNHADTESEEERDGRVVLTAKRDLPHDQADEMKALRESFLKTHYPNEVMTDSSEDEDDEALEQRHIASIIRPANISVSMLAGDGNPVRHSLVNLVLEEDLPMLMEAMSEECNVVFDDYTDSTTASTSSIIHAPNERRERRRQRNVDRISFVSEPPRVFSYLDEKSCEDGEWQEGLPISYTDYQKIVDEANEEQLQEQLELQRWQQRMQKQEPVERKNPSSDEYALGVTSKLSYGGLQSFNPIAIASHDPNTSSI